MGRIGFMWGVSGVIGILVFAIFRLGQRVLEMLSHEPGPLHWLVLVLFALYMAYAEGYRGFHQNFAPRVVVRAQHLHDYHPPWLVLLAPFYCMGFIHATPRRRLISLLLSSGILLLVLLVSYVPQPWRGVIDAGVVLGLAIGVLSILSFVVQIAVRGLPAPVAADLPATQA